MKNILIQLLLLLSAVSCQDNTEGKAVENSGFHTTSISKSSNDSLHNNAIEAWRNGNFQQALVYITQAYKKAKKENDEVSMAKALNNQGLVNWRLENSEDAMACYEEAARIAEKHKLYKLLGLTHTNRGLVLKEQNNLEMALRHNNQAITIFKQHDYFRELAIALNNQGQIFKKEMKNAEAKAYYLEALKNYKKENYKDGIAATYNNLADISLRENSRQTALDYIRRSVKLSIDINNKVQVNDGYKKMAEIYEHFHDPDSALKYYRIYTEGNTALLIANQSDKLAAYQANLGTEVRNLQISNLRKERQLARNRIWLIGICIIVGLLTGTFFVHRYLSKIRFRKRSLEMELSTSKKIIDIKEQELKAYIIDLTSKSSAIAKLQEQVVKHSQDSKTDSDVAGLLEQRILTEEDWEIFRSKFKAIYPFFFSRIRQSKVALSEAEIRLIVLLCLNLTGKEMANTLGISPQSVRVGKLRLKKKLQVEGYVSVEQFLPSLVKH